MKSYGKNGQMDLTDRVAIETGLCRGESFKEIAKKIGRHPSTISHEVFENRTLIPATYYAGKDCTRVRQCAVERLCRVPQHGCVITKCKYCIKVKCTTICDKYVSAACHRHDKPPYVCNTCKDRKLCIKEKFVYSATYADAAVSRRRSESRQGIRITEEQKKTVDKLVTRLVKKGQPLTHIYAEHEAEIPMSLRSLYNYIDAGELTVKNIDLRRKVGYKKRKKKRKTPYGFADQRFRKGKTYEDFESFMKNSGFGVVEMDTVKGVRERGKRLLTMIFQDNSIMLMFLLPDGTAESVKRIFDFLERGLGLERFMRLFPVILTDNGGEFKRPRDIEYTDDLIKRTNIFYCDPMASWQKAHIEKNHEYIRYVIPKGKSLNQYTQEDMTLLMNHINSTRRLRLGNKAPYELINEEDEDMWALFNLLKMDLIPPDEVHLMPDLFKLNR